MQLAGHDPLERPSLEYQHAFDQCAVDCHRVGGPVAVIASSAFYARELLKGSVALRLCWCPSGGGLRTRLSGLKRGRLESWR